MHSTADTAYNKTKRLYTQSPSLPSSGWTSSDDMWPQNENQVAGSERTAFTFYFGDVVTHFSMPNFHTLDVKTAT